MSLAYDNARNEKWRIADICKASYRSAGSSWILMNNFAAHLRVVNVAHQLPTTPATTGADKPGINHFAVAEGIRLVLPFGYRWLLFDKLVALLLRAEQSRLRYVSRRRRLHCENALRSSMPKVMFLVHILLRGCTATHPTADLPAVDYPKFFTHAPVRCASSVSQSVKFYIRRRPNRH
jgi:hypothetical protein